TVPKILAKVGLLVHPRHSQPYGASNLVVRFDFFRAHVDQYIAVDEREFSLLWKIIGLGPGAEAGQGADIARQAQTGAIQGDEVEWKTILLFSFTNRSHNGLFSHQLAA